MKFFELKSLAFFLQDMIEFALIETNGFSAGEKH